MTLAEETELRNFWCIVGELRQAAADDAPQHLIDCLLDELLGTELHTRNEVLRQRCIEVRLQYSAAGAAHSA